MKKNYAVYPHADSLQASNGSVSLEFSLFRIAPPHIALSMMEKGFMKDLNEKDDNGVPLLAVKSKNVNSKSVLPSWDLWAEDPSNVWGQEPVNPDTQHVLASMIFSGANPWIDWEPEHFDKKTRNLFSLAVLTGNVPLLKLLLSHPDCPSPETLDLYEVENTSLKTDTYRSIGPATFKLMHLAANSDQKEIVSLLLEKGLSIDPVDSYGRSPLFYALSADIAQVLIGKNASISLIDNNQENVGIYWKKNFPTAARQAEFNRILIDRMKKSMTIEEVQEIQKPALFLEITNGTKTNFESIFRKSKFQPTVTMSAKGATPDLLTYALLRTDDRREMFISWCLDKKIDISRPLWPDHPNLTNALVSVLPVGSPGPDLCRDFLEEKYLGKSKEFAEDIVMLCDRMIGSGFRVTQVLNFLMGYAVVKKSSSTQIGSNLSYELQPFGHTARYIDSFTKKKITPLPQNQSNRSSVYEHDLVSFRALDDITSQPLFWDVFTKAVKEKLKRSSVPKHHTSTQSSRIVEDWLQAEIKNGQKNAAPLLWTMLYNYCMSIEKSLYNTNVDEISTRRVDLIGYLKAEEKNIIIDPLEIDDIIQAIAKMPKEKQDGNPSLGMFSSLISSIGISQSLSHIDPSSRAPSKRRM